MVDGGANANDFQVISGVVYNGGVLRRHETIVCFVF